MTSCFGLGAGVKTSHSWIRSCGKKLDVLFKRFRLGKTYGVRHRETSFQRFCTSSGTFSVSKTHHFPRQKCVVLPLCQPHAP